MKQRKKQVGARWLARVRGVIGQGKLPGRPRPALQTAAAPRG
jgi:hypothetical protein